MKLMNTLISITSEYKALFSLSNYVPLIYDLKPTNLTGLVLGIIKIPILYGSGSGSMYKVNGSGMGKEFPTRIK